MRVSLGPLSALPTDECISVGEGRAIAFRLDADDTPRVFVNRCPHNGTSLDGAWIRDGVLTCPSHFWRFDASSGQISGGMRALESFPVEIVDGEVFAELPDEAPPRSTREQLLEWAREWETERLRSNDNL